MKGLVVSDGPGFDALRLRDDLPEPVPGPGEVLIRVKSAGVNFADAKGIMGIYATPPRPYTPGMEVAGTDPDGRPVLAFCPAGGWAELAVARRELVFDATGLDLEAAGAYPLVVLTCHFALAGMARLEPGQSVLVLAGAGGIGATAIQTARHLGAGHVVAVASTAEKRNFALAQGADEAIAYEDPFPAADVTLDGVGGEAFLKAYRASRPFARMVLIGSSSGTAPSIPDFGELRQRSVALMPFSFGAMRQSNPAAVAEEAPGAFQAVREGRVRPPIGLRLPLSEGRVGLERLVGRQTMGKVVLHP